MSHRFRDCVGLDRQSPIASFQRMRSTLASHSAVPLKMNVTRTNTNRAIQIATERTQGLRGLISVFWGRYEHQRSLAIRIAAITLASDSAITTARFRPSKVQNRLWGFPESRSKAAFLPPFCPYPSGPVPSLTPFPLFTSPFIPPFLTPGKL